MPFAITREPAPSLADCELTYLDRAPIDLDTAQRQHAAYCAALTAAGLEVLALPAAADYPDSVFVEDVAVVLDELAVLTRPGAASRQGEVALMEGALSGYRPVVSISTGLTGSNMAPTIEGGDVLRIGRTLYVGQSTRTNAAGAEALRALASPLGYAVTRVPVSGCLHLKTGVTAVTDGVLLANPAWVDLSAFNGFEIIPVHPAEPWAANILRLSAAIVANAAYPRTLDRLTRRGLDPLPLDISEFGKAEAGLTCLSLVLD